MEIGHPLGEHRRINRPLALTRTPTSLVTPLSPPVLESYRTPLASGTYRPIRRGFWCRSSIPTMVAQATGLRFWIQYQVAPLLGPLASIADSTQLPKEHNVQRRARGDRTHPFLGDARTLVETSRQSQRLTGLLERPPRSHRPHTPSKDRGGRRGDAAVR